MKMNKLAAIPEGLTFDDVLLVPRYSPLKSRAEADVSWTLTEGRYGQSITHHFNNPVIPANMDTITGKKMMFKMCQLEGVGILHRRLPIAEMQQVLDDCHGVNMPVQRAVSVGSIHSDKERIDHLLAEKDITKAATIICVDIAHGHSIHMKDTLEYIRKKGFKGPIIAGNVVTHQATKDLYYWGATAVKVGVGPGSVCTTRIKTGCGYPQLSAISDCAQSIDYNIYSGRGPKHVPLIADGGITSPGDAAKALAAGATAVMIGGMLAGTDCVPGWDEVMKPYDVFVCDDCDRQYSWAQYAGYTACPKCKSDKVDKGQITPSTGTIIFRGMASKEARAAVGEPETNAEGVSRTVECKPAGSTQAVINDIIEGIKSAMSYTGCATLEQFRQESQFVRISSTAENHPHFKG